MYIHVSICIRAGLEPTLLPYLYNSRGICIVYILLFYPDIVLTSPSLPYPDNAIYVPE